MKLSEVPIGAHVRNPSTGEWQQVADVVRVRDGSGNIRLTFVDGGRFVAGPNELVEVRATAEDVPADLMRAAELAAYEALKEDHREPTALWAALVHKAVAAVLPLHEHRVREQIAAELDKQARKEADRDVDGPYCKEAATFTRAAQMARGSDA